MNISIIQIYLPKAIGLLQEIEIWTELTFFVQKKIFLIN